MLKRVSDDLENSLFFRHETSDGQWEVGIYPVLFGFRIRAGKVGDMLYLLDMCIGDNWSMMDCIFPIVCNIIEQRGHVPDIEEWPTVTIKPVWRDQDYMIQLNLMDGDPGSREEYDIPDLSAIRRSNIAHHSLWYHNL